jgi:hypothetical protein
MITYLVLAALMCPKVELINLSEPLPHEDQQAFNRAAFVCSFRYKNSPCLVKFEKKAPQAYHATCGAKR